MCDTFVALGCATKNKNTLFAKNSDRDPNEAHYIELVKEARHAPGEQVKCTYINIPQVVRTHRVLLAKPFWIWGGEMGGNEFGVVIGNEAVFTRVNDAKTPRLQGMDLLRLALERSKSAEEAMHVIIDLLKKYGQGGNCGFTHPFYYDNSFMIADSTSAWVLETAGKEWAAERVKSVRSISNRLTIGTKWDLASDDLVRYAVDKGWCRKRSDFNFSKCYSDPVMNYLSGSALRLECTRSMLEQKTGCLTAKDMMDILRQHPSASDGDWSPDKGLKKSQVCMHVGAGPIRINQTTGSMVSEISKNDQIHWFTGTSSPCLSVFKPVWITSGLPLMEPVPQGVYNPSTLWWRHEAFVRRAAKNYPAIRDMIRGDQEKLEEDSWQLIDEARRFTGSQKLDYSNQKWTEAERRLQVWRENIEGVPYRRGVSLLYLNTIAKHNRVAHLDIHE